MKNNIIALLVLKYILNLTFSFFQFNQKDLILATLDCLLVDVTTFHSYHLFIMLSKVAALLLMPYLLCATFATYLSWAIHSMN
ncbi:tryptophan-rich sensory protein [Bacillus cereus]|uniref:Tryptophan-rich sensory protein n=1 Tax=Bacillus cereus TaxID=1396 RepID=A0A2A8Q1V8_BACCE|nr:TspO/MBR family protein [Bacillus cereus]PEA06817.1 tryptophan-rich sensory protein [Bacillus cereus]PEW06720.1 tryptophan-rich sensory protein [Bacillus cereus]PFI26276.1 tryptophan-rich sensory protein [Bacillus cereus]